MANVPLSILLRAVDKVERAELPLLSWGLVDGGFSESDFMACLDEICGEDECSADDLVDSLLDAGLIVRLHYSGTDVFRTRMAETVRLLSRQRQLFENHLEGNRWSVAPTLVADYRLRLRARRYPAAISRQHISMQN